MTQRFHVGHVLSITTGRLVSTAHIGGVYDILNHMTGDDLYTHQLGRASNECRPWLLRWFPELAKASDHIGELADMVDSQGPENGCAEWIKMVRDAHPEIRDEYNVPQIPRDDHEVRDPVEELEAMIGKDRVIVVQPPDHDQ